ncbi:MAG: hypothetical protein Q8O89_06375 [Nanoarchaeota archaeon]|nr:hypothetical protein [Nanoarchaeota archaeon]
MDKIERFANIGGKKVGVILIFDSYKERQFKQDFEEFKAYQQKSNLEGGKDLKFYKQLKAKGLRDFKPIPYALFREYTANFFSKSLFNALKFNPQFIVSDELNIQIKLIKVKNRSYYFEFMDQQCDPENACFDGAGIWFLQTIVAPFFYFQHIDYKIIERYFLHELTHFTDQMKKYVMFDAKYASKIKTFSKKKSAYCLNYLYNSIFNLREEGLPDFVARKDSPRIDINMVGVHLYNQNLEKLTRLTKKADAEVFYEKQIGWENLTPSSEYVNGRVMCTTIALLIAKTEKIPYQLVAGNKTYTGYDIKELDNILSSNKLIYVVNLDKRVIYAAIKLIGPKPGYRFIKMYQDACTALGISERNRVMTLRRLAVLAKQASQIGINERKRRLNKGGFVG